jgi:hypothetical protein
MPETIPSSFCYDIDSGIEDTSASESSVLPRTIMVAKNALDNR